MLTPTLGQNGLGKRSRLHALVRSFELKPLASGAALFALNFLKHPQMLGTIFPSSRFLAARVLSRIPWDRCKVIVEYGPGVGQITMEILRRMNADAVLVGIELNRDFVRYLRRTIRDLRLQLICGSAAEVRTVLQRLGHANADCVIAGIPFSRVERLQRREILSETHAALAEDGRLTVYQYSRTVQTDLEQTFGRVEREREFVNFVPAQLFHCVKRAAASSRTRNGVAPCVQRGD
ncbi:MAG TPA: methyltransferase domain-containing protein [Verrucomicrobiae bacterium]|nr:methyltransferase domain-containing protein [Verrucomicrobiae bacterium]